MALQARECQPRSTIALPSDGSRHTASSARAFRLFSCPSATAWATRLLGAGLSEGQLWAQEWGLGLRRELVYYRNPRNPGGSRRQRGCSGTSPASSREYHLRRTPAMRTTNWRRQLIRSSTASKRHRRPTRRNGPTWSTMAKAPTPTSIALLRKARPRSRQQAMSTRGARVSDSRGKPGDRGRREPIGCRVSPRSMLRVPRRR